MKKKREGSGRGGGGGGGGGVTLTLASCRRVTVNFRQTVIYDNITILEIKYF